MSKDNENDGAFSSSPKAGEVLKHTGMKAEVPRPAKVGTNSSQPKPAQVTISAKPPRPKH